MPREVEGLNMNRLKRSIRWRGNVRLYQLNEDDESLLGEWEWPKRSGAVYYACATSGLLFDKQTGRCLQSPNVMLLLDSLSPAAPRDFSKFMAVRKKMDCGRTSKHLIVEA